MLAARLYLYIREDLQIDNIIKYHMKDNFYFYSVSGCTCDDVYRFWLFNDFPQTVRLLGGIYEFPHCGNDPTVGNSVSRILPWMGWDEDSHRYNQV